jgi:Flp pilus assembly protein TadG
MRMTFHLHIPLRLCRRPRLGDSGQAMLEACVLIPVLLSLFLGLWHYALLSQAQTRSLLAARHAAWARATLNKSDSDLQQYAAPFFPTGTTLHIQAERQASTYAEYHNNLVSYCAIFTAIDNDNQHRITLSADVPALPFAPPQSPGRTESGTMDFLAKATTHPVVVVRNYCGEQPTMTTLSLIAFTVLRPDLLVEAGIKIAISEAFNKLMDKLSEIISGSGWFGKFMEKIGLSFLSDIFKDIVGAALWLINDLIEIIKSYSK